MSERLALLIAAPGDEDCIAVRPDFQALRDAQGGDMPKGPAWTLHSETGPIAMGGFERQADGAWMAWGLACDLTPRRWAVVGASIRWVLEAMPGPVLATVRTDMPAAVRFLRRLGFRPTGQIHDGGDGHHYEAFRLERGA